MCTVSARGGILGFARKTGNNILHQCVYGILFPIFCDRQDSVNKNRR